MMLRLFSLGECIYNRHVERRGQYGVEHLRHPGIVLHLNLSVGSVGCLGVFLILCMHKTYRRWIFHFPSLGYMVGITYHRRHMPHRTLNSTARPLQVVFAATYSKSGEERGVWLVGILEIVSWGNCHIAHLYGLVLFGVSPPRIYESRFCRQILCQWHFQRRVDECHHVIQEVCLHEDDWFACRVMAVASFVESFWLSQSVAIRHCEYYDNDW